MIIFIANNLTQQSHSQENETDSFPAAQIQMLYLHHPHQRKRWVATKQRTANKPSSWSLHYSDGNMFPQAQLEITGVTCFHKPNWRSLV
jgi:hypothetical protein